MNGCPGFAPGSSQACRKRLTKTVRHGKAADVIVCKRRMVFSAGKRARTATMQPQGFETGFWKDANYRKSWDEIVPGAPRKYVRNQNDERVATGKAMVEFQHEAAA
jgi:hypothetical protein